ncbi:MAG TPA: peptidase C26 [Cyanobacteria bacterium UBA8803]|nr:peptidase C26 [Cyanobacteria bacterium UBA9273]HBL62694.1 peptidase C26 [Cyanobacteria bacterium UBA8803]
MTPRLPIIGITTYNHKETGNFYSPAGYTQAVQSSGGVPILLPPVKTDPAAFLKIVDGLILTGGGDLHPDCYKGSSHPTIYGVDQDRDAAELALARLALAEQKPILGICRGLEVLMVASGGDLIPHLPEEVGNAVIHRLELVSPCEHRVQLMPDSQLASIMGRQEIMVVSWHHQAVRSVPPSWQIAAQAPDGVIEALEHKQHPFAIALQWHPELSLNDPLQMCIFQAFIKAATASQEGIARDTFHLHTAGWGCR